MMGALYEIVVRYGSCLKGLFRVVVRQTCAKNGGWNGQRDWRAVVVLLPSLREEAAPPPGWGCMSGSAGPLPGTPLRVVRGDHRGAGGLDA